jgi:peptidyl-prolyl cis-trans isomerase SurA
VRHIIKIPQITNDEIKIAVEHLDSVRTKLIAGTMGFGEAVAKYSEDEVAKYTGGMQQCGQGSTFCSIADLDKDIVTILPKLKQGEYSQPSVVADERGKKSVRILYLRTRTQPHRENMKDDYNRIAQRALEEKKGEAIERWFNGKISTYYVMVDDDYKNCPQLAKWMQNAANTDK